MSLLNLNVEDCKQANGRDSCFRYSKLQTASHPKWCEPKCLHAEPALAEVSDIRFQRYATGASRSFCRPWFFIAKRVKEERYLRDCVHGETTRTQQSTGHVWWGTSKRPWPLQLLDASDPPNLHGWRWWLSDEISRYIQASSKQSGKLNYLGGVQADR